MLEDHTKLVIKQIEKGNYKSFAIVAVNSEGSLSSVKFDPLEGVLMVLVLKSIVKRSLKRNGLSYHDYEKQARLMVETADNGEIDLKR